MRDNKPSYKNGSDRRTSKTRCPFRRLFLKTLSLILAAALTVSVHVRSRTDSQCVDPRKWALVEADLRIRLTFGEARRDCPE